MSFDPLVTNPGRLSILTALAVEGRELESVAVVRPVTPVRLPVVLSREAVGALLGVLSGSPQLVALLLYGSGLRLLEALQLRVKDVDFISGEIVVRRGKGQTDRITMLANSAAEELERVRRQHQKDLVTGGGYVPLPGALHRKSPGSPGSGSGSMSFLPRAGMWMG